MKFIRYIHIFKIIAKENNLPLPIEKNLSFYVGFFRDLKLDADAISSEENLMDAMQNHIDVKNN